MFLSPVQYFLQVIKMLLIIFSCNNRLRCNLFLLFLLGFDALICAKWLRLSQIPGDCIGTILGGFRSLSTLVTLPPPPSDDNYTCLRSVLVNFVSIPPPPPASSTNMSSMRGRGDIFLAIVGDLR